MNPYELLGDDDASVEQLSKKVAAQATVSSKPTAAAAAAPKTAGTYALKALEGALRIEFVAVKLEVWRAPSFRDERLRNKRAEGTAAGVGGRFRSAFGIGLFFFDDGQSG